VVDDVPAEHLQRIADRIAPLSVPPHLRRWLWTFAPLVVVLLLAQPARGDADGGAPGGADAAVTETGAPDAAAAPAVPPGPPELVTPPELSAASLTKPEPQLVTPPADVEPPRPITRRLWFWIAVSCAIVVTTGLVMAVQNPSTTRPDCPDGYVCPR
jgi:hypothetical protein